MTVKDLLKLEILKALKLSYDVAIDHIEFQSTRKNFEGDITVVAFYFTKFIKDKPETIASNIGDYLLKNVNQVKSYNVVKGFLNLVISDVHYIQFIKDVGRSPLGIPYEKPSPKESVVIEYSSPNTNKPLHLGHVRNNILGFSASRILEVTGYKVYKTQIINDRGIHICKSMLAWQKFGKGETPKSLNVKGDKLVGKYYVLFDGHYQEQISHLIAEGMDEQIAKKKAPILLEAQDMLQRWENGDVGVRDLWKTMNGWVYEGFDVTYKALRIDFNKLYYESDTYLLGKEVVNEGLKKGVFFQKKDGSVWIDLTKEGLDEKLLLRSDGTSVYMTQDLGTALQRAKDFPKVTSMVYTVGNEQDYHFKVLFIILKKMGYSWAKSLYHLSYGMVDLPQGKMKSREGTAVDADDLISNMINQAKQTSKKLGKLEGYTSEEKEKIYKIIGLGALKYYLLKVDPQKRILFDPKESIDFNGNTGPFIQYAYARICSILKNIEEEDGEPATELSLNLSLDYREKELIKHLELLPQKLSDASKKISPAEIANYTYDLVKLFNSFYQNISILRAPTNELKFFRKQLCEIVGGTIKFNFYLLGIEVPEKM